MSNELNEQRRLAGLPDLPEEKPELPEAKKEPERKMEDPDIEKRAKFKVQWLLSEMMGTLKKGFPMVAKELAKEAGISEKEALSWIAREFNSFKAFSLWKGTSDMGPTGVTADFSSGLD